MICTKKAAVVLACFIGLSLTSCSVSNSSGADNSQETTASETAADTTPESDLQRVLIYSMTVSDSDDTINQTTFDVPNSETLQNKLQLIANEVSSTNFGGLGIKVAKIEDNIAYINLTDDADTSAESGWIQQFQGSTGAYITAVNLFENFFQKQLSCNWIDAVQLMHNGEVMEEMDHFRDVGVVYKDKNYLTLSD